MLQNMAEGDVYLTNEPYDTGTYISNENTEFLPWGLNGGSGSGASKFVFWLGTKKEVTFVKERVSDYGPFDEVDKLSFCMIRGGGWGNSKNRDKR